MRWDSTADMKNGIMQKDKTCESGFFQTSGSSKSGDWAIIILVDIFKCKNGINNAKTGIWHKINIKSRE